MVGITSVRDYIIRVRVKYDDQEIKNWFKLVLIHFKNQIKPTTFYRH